MTKFAQLNSLETALGNSSLSVDNETEFYFDFSEGMSLEDDKEFRGDPDQTGEDAKQPSDKGEEESGRDSKEPGETETADENPSAEEDFSGSEILPDDETSSENDFASKEDDLPIPEQGSNGKIIGGQDFTGLRGYSRQEKDGTIEITREFDSWYEFVTCVSNEKLYTWKQYHCSHDPNSAGGIANFRGTESFAQAEEMALRSGWPEGRKMLHDFLLEIQPKPIIRPASEFDLGGMFPCVPIYCAGDPACMFADSETNMRISKPTIQIDFSQVVSYNVPTRSIMLRGAAVLSLVNSLELAGQSVELRLVGANICYKYSFFNYITYKRASQPLDLDRAAFAIAHPSTLRRFILALWEQHGEIEDDFGGGYGLPNKTRPPLSQNSIFIPGAIQNETPETAKLAIKLAAQHILGEKQ